MGNSSFPIPIPYYLYSAFGLSDIVLPPSYSIYLTSFLSSSTFSSVLFSHLLFSLYIPHVCVCVYLCVYVCVCVCVSNTRTSMFMSLTYESECRITSGELLRRNRDRESPKSLLTLQKKP